MLGGITPLGIHTYLSFSLLADDEKTSLPASGWGYLFCCSGEVDEPP